MKKWMMVCVTVVGLSFWGCNQPTPPAPKGGGATTVSQIGPATSANASLAIAAHDHGDVLVYCATCGEVAHSENCCNPDAMKCEACGKQAGAPLCCKGLDASLNGSELCSKCGEVVGDEKCCAEGAEICEKCGLHAGAPLCCKLVADE